MSKQIRIILSAVLVLAGVARGDTPEATKSATGTISEYVPGKSLVLQQENGAVNYRPADQVMRR